MSSLLPSIIGFVGGFVSALFAEPLRRWLFASKLELAFGTSQPFITRTPEVGPAGQYESLWVRVKVQNSSFHLAKSCRAYLVQVERMNATGEFEPTEYCESLQLAWSSQAELSYGAFDLPRGVSHYVDIISTRPVSPAFTLATKVTPFRYTKMLSTVGTYRFTVVVSGDGVKPATIQATVEWNGKWDSVKKV